MNVKNDYKIPDELYEDIADYCHTNELDVKKFIDNLLLTAFITFKYEQYAPNVVDEIVEDEVKTEYTKVTKSIKVSEKNETSENKPVDGSPRYRLSNSDNYEHFD